MNTSFWLADVQLFQVRVLEGCYRREGILLMALCLFLSLSLAASIEHIQAVSACPSAGLQVLLFRGALPIRLSLPVIWQEDPCSSGFISPLQACSIWEQHRHHLHHLVGLYLLNLVP